MTHTWVQDFKEAIYDSVRNLPQEISLSFSGGIDSSMLLFTMIELRRPPKELITFEIEGEYSKDLEYARQIAKYYDLPLKVATIPSDPIRDDLLREVKEVIKTTRTTRNIETQVCHAYSYMRNQMTTPYLVTGFYTTMFAHSGAKVNSLWGAYKKGGSRVALDNYFKNLVEKELEEKYPSGSPHNLWVIRQFLKSKGVEVLCPFRTPRIESLCKSLLWDQLLLNPASNKIQPKWFITEHTHKEYFDKHKTNRSNFHTTGKSGGLKGLHRRVLLAGTSYKDTRAIYNQILKDIEFEEKAMFNVKL
jgi:hypothetical protein